MLKAMSVSQYASHYGLKPDAVRKSCQQGRIEGAFKPGGGVKPHWRIWVEVPETMEEAVERARKKRPTAAATAIGRNDE